MDWIRRTLFSRRAYAAPPAVSEDERRAVEDAISHSTEARSRSSATIDQWERVTAGAWGLRRPNDA